MMISFEKANLTHKDVIFKWLEEPHVQEFWDNSQAHKDDILDFMNGYKDLFPYFEGIYTYWMGSINDQPYSFFLTSEVQDKFALESHHVSKTGKIFTIDFCIGNKDFLGKGLGAKTLIAFTEFFRSNVDVKADTFFIDPDESNLRARHVYEKAGFQLVGDFIMKGDVFDGQRTDLMVKRI